MGQVVPPRPEPACLGPEPAQSKNNEGRKKEASTKNIATLRASQLPKGLSGFFA